MTRRRILVKGGHVVTVDAELGVIPDGEVLIEDDIIVAVGPHLGVTDAEVVHAEGGIIAPGTVDTHRHTWQTQLRGCCGSMSLQEYIQGFWADSTPSYTADDARLGTLVGALEALDAGVTTLLDYAHITNTPEHADAGVDALTEAGIRGVYAYGLGQSNIFAPPDYDRMADFARIAKARFSGSGRVTLAAALSEIGLSPISVNQAQKRLADEHGAVSTVHIGSSKALPSGIAQLAAAGVLDARMVLVHATALSADDWDTVAKSGAWLSSTPESELHMGMGRPGILDALRRGMKPTIGVDVVSLNSGDILTPTRQALGFVRWADAEPALLQGRDIYGITIHPADALKWATLNGAEAVGLGQRTGSLTPGKQADLIVVSGRHIGVRPVHDPVTQLVMHTQPGHIDTVIVGGRIVKRDGHLVGVQLAPLLAQLEASSQQVKARMAAFAAKKVPPTPEQIAGFPHWVQHNLSS